MNEDIDDDNGAMVEGEYDSVTGDYEYAYDLDIYIEPVSVEILIRRFEKGLISIPDYQRPYVWGSKDEGPRHRPSLFIDSVLLGLPVPSFVFYRYGLGEKGEMLVVDGQQRLRTLVNFKNNKFELKGSDIDKNWAGKTYEQLEDKDGGDFIDTRFNERRIPVVFIRQLPSKNQSPDQPQDHSSMYKIFDRLNSGGISLHPHEIRMALASVNADSSDLFSFIKEDIFKKYEESVWKKILPRSYLRNDNYGKKMEVMFRVFVFSLFYKTYKKPVRTFLDSVAKKTWKDYEDTSGLSQEQLKSSFVQSVNLLEQLVNSHHKDELFNPKTQFNLAFFESFWVGLLCYVYKHIKQTGQVQLTIEQMWDCHEHPDMKQAGKYGALANDETKINKRFGESIEIFDGLDHA
jgi:hypothetical protein